MQGTAYLVKGLIEIDLNLQKKKKLSPNLSKPSEKVEYLEGERKEVYNAER